MKVGILTFHRALNYGAVLQCYALQEVLRKLGHETYVIDYRQPKIEKNQDVPTFVGCVKNVLCFSLYDYLKKSRKVCVKAEIFKKFRDRYLNISDLCTDCNDIRDDYDAYIIGSDQLVNYNITGCLDKVYCGYFKKRITGKLISYAISGRLDLLKKIPKDKVIQFIGNFDYYSFRECDLASYVESAVNRKIYTCLDPTLISNSDIWNKMILPSDSSRDYVVIYQVRKSHGIDKLIYARAKKIADANNLDLVDISSDIEVDRWVTTIKYAKCVITTSFHATVFSLIFKRPLIAFVLGEAADKRYTELLKSVGMEDSIKNISDPLSSIPLFDDRVSEKFREIRASSLNYLTQAINGGMDSIV